MRTVTAAQDWINPKPERAFILVDSLDEWPYNRHILKQKEPTMLKMIGIAAVVYVGWITGIIQAAMILTAAGLTTIAGL